MASTAPALPDPPVHAADPCKMPPLAPETVLAAFHDVRLNTHEMAILQGSADGLTYKEIADNIGRSYNGIKNTAHSLLGKLGCQSIAQAVAAALRRGLID